MRGPGGCGVTSGTEQATPWVSDPSYAWCQRCQKSTLITCSIVVATSHGVGVVGGYASCEACGWSPYAEAAGSDG